MVWIALAAQLSSPQPIKREIWFSPDDMPAYVQRRGESLTVGVRAIVRPDGSLQQCEIESGSGDPNLDLFTCSLVMKRAKFEPARWVDGSAAYGVHRMPVVWAIDYAPPHEGDLVLTVDHLPKGVHSPALVRLMFAADEAGHLVSCAPAPPIRHLRDNDPALVPIACDQLVKSYKAIPAKDTAGVAVRSVQTALVRFDRAKK